MSGIQGVGGSPSRVGEQGAANRTNAAPPSRGPASTGDLGSGAVAEFDPFTALVEAAQGAGAPPAAGLQAQLLDWAAPTTRQFEAVSPARLLPLLGVAVDRLAEEAQRGDELDQLGAVALERELRDHYALAERRATLIQP